MMNKSCILCDYRLDASAISDGFTPNQTVNCPVCKSYYYNPGFYHDFVEIFNREEYEQMSLVEKQNKIYYEFQENRHKLSGYFFEVHERFGGMEKAKEYEKLYLPLCRYRDILKSPLIPDDFDYQAKIKKFLRYLSFKTKTIGDRIHIHDNNSNYLRPVFYAKTENEVSMYVRKCIDNGFIDGECIKFITIQTGQTELHAPLGFSLTLEGLDYIREEDPESKDIFVAMAFKQEMYDIFNKRQFRDDIEKATGGYRISIISEREHNQSIDDEIIAAIKQSKAVIADLTHGNQGAYYEAGYAHGKDMEVIFTCRKKEFDDERKRPHFDINHRNFIVWKDPEDLKQKLINRINATIR